MKQTNSDLIGKVLEVDEMQISRANDALKKVLPHVRAVVDQYNSLQSLPAFTQITWEGILNDNGKAIEEKYLKQAEADLKQFKNASFVAGIMNNVGMALDPLRDAIKAARKAVQDAAFSGVTGSVNISLRDIRIEKGAPVVDLTNVREAYTLKIENEAEAEVYRAGKDAEKALERLRSLLAGTESDPYRISWGCSAGSYGVFSFDIPTAKVTFDVTCVASAKQMEEVPA